MNLLVVFASASMFCAGLNDFVFKRYVSKNRPQGVYLALIGVFWSLIFLSAAVFSGGLRFDRNTLVYGLVCGFFSIAAQVFFLEGLRKIKASIGATIYRLNFVVVVILAPVFLHETLTVYKLAGIFLAIVAVFLLAGDGNCLETGFRRSATIPVLLVTAASILRGFMGFFYKVAQLNCVDTNTFLFLNPLLWIVGGIIYAVFFERAAVRNTDKRLVAYSGISSVLIAGIALFLLLAVKSGEAIAAVPITQMSFVVTGIFSVWLLKERVTRFNAAGIACALGTIICLSIR